MTFGPVSATVLMSLHQIGLPAMRQELGDLRRAIEAEAGPYERAAAVDRAVLAWRLNGLVGRLAERRITHGHVAQGTEVAGPAKSQMTKPCRAAISLISSTESWSPS